MADEQAELDAERAAFFENLVRSWQAVRRGEHQVVRSTQREALLLVEQPAYGRSTALMVEAVRGAAFARGLPTPRPEAFRVGFSDPVQVMTWTPVTRFDQSDPELVKVTWTEGGRRLYVNLNEFFQPRSLTVPDGMIMEIPVKLEEVPDWGPTLLFFLADQRLRPIREVEQEDRAEEAEPQAAGAQE